MSTSPPRGGLHGGSGGGSGAESRITKETNSVNGSDVGIPASEETGIRSGVGVAELFGYLGRRVSEDAIGEFYREYPDLARLPLTDRHGETLREEYTKPVEWGEDREMVQPVTWGEAVGQLCEDHEDTRRTTVNLEKGRPGTGEYEEWSVDAETRWFSAYQKKCFAQMKGWLRELIGGARPSGGVVEGAFEDPRVVLLARTASSTPGDERLSPVDHAAPIAEAWEPVYHTLRNTMRAAGLELGDDWQYMRRQEPHKGERGGGANHAYTHEHPVIVFDAAKMDGEPTEEMFRPIVEKHVEVCDPAGAEAHDLDKDWSALEYQDQEKKTVSMKDPVEMDNPLDLANYVADYTSIRPVDLLERDPEYVGWAAAVTAGNLNVMTRSDSALYASKADACKQRCESERSDQESEHGEMVVRSEKRGYEFECAVCGSPWQVDQDHETLVSARLSVDDGGQEAVADGGRDFEREREDELRERWPSARAAAVVGETSRRQQQRERVEVELERRPHSTVVGVLGQLGLSPDAGLLVEEVRAGVDCSEPVGFDRPPDWRVKSVTVGESEYPASAGSGVEMVETVNFRAAMGVEDGQKYRCRCGTAAHGESIIGHVVGVHGIEHPEIGARVVTRVTPRKTHQ